MVTGTAPPLFVGRRVEMERLTSLARQAAAGNGAAVPIEGEPGIGKTTLLDAVAGTPVNGGVRLINPAAFARPAAGRVGNTGRNAFRGPGFYNIDISLLGRFRKK